MGKKDKENIAADDKQMEDVSFEDHIDGDEIVEEESKSPKTTRKSRSKKKSGKDIIAAYEEKCEDLNDKYLRLYSEFDNYRKRTSKERLDLLKTASQDIMVELLPVLDDFDRALQSMTDHNAQEESVKGVELIYNKLFTLLKQKGLEPMEAQGKEFNTDYHEAITNIPAPNKKMKGKVVDVVQKGYLLNGKIIRFAKVVVGN